MIPDSAILSGVRAPSSVLSLNPGNDVDARTLVGSCERLGRRCASARGRVLMPVGLALWMATIGPEGSGAGQRKRQANAACNRPGASDWPIVRVAA